MGEWKETCLSNICSDISYGYTASAKEYPLGPKFLRITDIVPERIDWNSVPYCEADEMTLNKYKLQNGDIVIARTGATTGYNKIIKNIAFDAVFASYLIRYKIDSNIACPDYIGHLLQSSNWYEYINAIAGGSAQPGANAKQLGSFEVLLPPLPEQRAIAGVLSSLDDKIDLLHRQNKTLEAMAETLFRQWFVEEAEEGWEETTISSIFDFNPPRALQKGKTAPYLEMSNVSTSVFHPVNWYDREYTSGMKFINGDTLLARITPCLENGKSAFITFLEENNVGWGSTEFLILRPKQGYHPLTAYAMVKNDVFRDYAEGCLEGSSGRQRVNIDHLKNYTIMIPPANKLATFNQAMEDLEPKLHLDFIQIRILGKYRDTLLPKLMSGELKVL